MNIFCFASNNSEIYNFLANNNKVSKIYPYNANSSKSIDYYQEIYRKIKKCSIVVIDVSDEKINLYYIISLALELDKQIVLLYSGKEPEIVRRLLSLKKMRDNIQIVDYNKNNLQAQLKQVLDLSRANLDTRFTILIPPRQMDFLDKVSYDNKIPKSVYIRQLIEDQIKNLSIKC